MSDWVQKLVEDYYNFLKGKTQITTETGTGWSVISTPFTGLFNDTIEIYTTKKEEKILANGFSK